MDYAKFARLSDVEKERIRNIDLQILELRREKMKILKEKSTLFEEERDYLASKIPDFYVNGCSSRHRNVVINPKYASLWTGIRQAAEYKVFHLHKVPKEATEDQILQVKKEIINEIDWLDKEIIQKGLLWI